MNSVLFLRIKAKTDLHRSPPGTEINLKHFLVVLGWAYANVKQT